MKNYILTYVALAALLAIVCLRILPLPEKERFLASIHAMPDEQHPAQVWHRVVFNVSEQGIDLPMVPGQTAAFQFDLRQPTRLIARCQSPHETKLAFRVVQAGAEEPVLTAEGPGLSHLLKEGSYEVHVEVLPPGQALAAAGQADPLDAFADDAMGRVVVNAIY